MQMSPSLNWSPPGARTSKISWWNENTKIYKQNGGRDEKKNNKELRREHEKGYLISFHRFENVLRFDHYPGRLNIESMLMVFEK